MVEIEVISSCLVATTINISMPKLELNDWDLRLLPKVYMQRGLLFHNPNSQQLQQTLIDHLKNSLSRTLDFFPPLAGRLSTTAHDGDTSRFFIDCNNAGAEFTHAVAPAVSVSDVLEDKHTHEFVSPFFPLNGVYNVDGVSTPLLAVKVTELADGVFIGCAANHAVVDGTSFWHFVNSWSQISRGCDSISKHPVFERWFPSSAAAADYAKRLVHLPTLEKDPTHGIQTPKRIFHFSKENLAALKAKANSEAGSDKISTLQAVIAHLWRSTTRCGSSSEESDIVMVIGTRARLPLPEGYFGNAFCAGLFAMSESELLQRGLGDTALKINEFVSRQTREAIIRDVEKKPTTLGHWPALIIASSPRHDVYGNDFGWGKPIALRSEVVDKSPGLVRAFPAAEAGGIDLEVFLAQEVLKALECDAEFMVPVGTIN